jgi:hypothetical protein
MFVMFISVVFGRGSAGLVSGLVGNVGSEVSLWNENN